MVYGLGFRQGKKPIEDTRAELLGANSQGPPSAHLFAVAVQDLGLRLSNRLFTACNFGSSCRILRSLRVRV